MDSIVISAARAVIDDDLAPVDVLIEGSSIAQVAKAGELRATRTIDASSLWILPGAIDSHVHPIHNETFASTGSAALYGGVTTVLHHLYPARGETNEQAVERVEPDAAEGGADFGFHVRVTRDRLPVDATAGRHSRPASLKVFLAHTDPEVELTAEELWAVMAAAARTGTVVYVHSELGSVTRVAGEALAMTDLRDWSNTRPPPLEAAAVTTVLALAAMTGCRVHLPHLSSADAVEAALNARARWGVEATLETCPHYLFLSYDSVSGGEGRVAPPLRAPDELAEMRRHVATGDIDLIASDHCGYAAEKKDVPELRDAANGLPGIEVMFPLLLDAAINADWFTPKRLVEALAEGPARAFGLQQKGHLAVGYDADLVLVDPAARTTIRHQDLHDRASYSPYEGTAVSGKVTHVFRRGELVVEEGTLLDRTPARQVTTA